MSKKLPFVKYSCYGNSFVILDEIPGKLLSEEELSDFAYQATDVNFGVGADNLLVIQRCTDDSLQAIKSSHRYWQEIPATGSDYIFRMFEPNGDEALCCGNGLMCIAHHLNHNYSTVSASIMTEVPLICPNNTEVGVQPESTRTWVNLGIPRRLPDSLVNLSIRPEYMGSIQVVSDLKIKFREHDLKPYTNETELYINAYLIFTGEPHMVIFLDMDGLSVPGMSDVVFADSDGNKGAGPIFRQRIRYGTWFLERVGQYINTHYRELFPIGMNVNFVRTDFEGNVVEYRCYERGINKETLACGTGAMAVAYVSSKILEYEAGEMNVLPHRCRWYRENAKIQVVPDSNGWKLSGQPHRIMEADYIFGID